MGWGRAAAFISLRWAVQGPRPTSISIPSLWHLAAIIGGADCGPLPLSGKQAQLGPRHICRISTEHSWVCPEPRSPKHKGGRGAKKSPDPRDRHTDTSANRHSSKRSYTHQHTLPHVQRRRTGKHAITQPRLPPPLPSSSPSSSPRLPSTTQTISELPWTLVWREQGSHQPQTPFWEGRVLVRDFKAHPEKLPDLLLSLYLSPQRSPSETLILATAWM